MSADRTSESIRTETQDFPAATKLPLVVHRGAIESGGAAAAEACKRLFAQNAWTGAWINGVYDYHHFHATTHEALGIARGRASVRFGGKDGSVITLGAGDVVIIPAGLSHCNEGATKGLMVVGAYPGGAEPDNVKGTPEGKPAEAQKLQRVALPSADPVFGRAGPLLRFWAKADSR